MLLRSRERLLVDCWRMERTLPRSPPRTGGMSAAAMETAVEKGRKCSAKVFVGHEHANSARRSFELIHQAARACRSRACSERCKRLMVRTIDPRNGCLGAGVRLECAPRRASEPFDKGRRVFFGRCICLASEASGTVVIRGYSHANAGGRSSSAIVEFVHAGRKGGLQEQVNAATVGTRRAQRKLQAKSNQLQHSLTPWHLLLNRRFPARGS